MPASPSAPSTPRRTLRTHTIPALPLDSGATLRHVRMAYHLDGPLAPALDNVVLVLHALTGSADAADDWWREVIGAQRALDTTRWAVLAPNLLGSCYGSAGPALAGAEPFPRITVRDQARAVALLLDGLGIERVALVTGGSLGGMVALELAASFPGRVERAAVFAAGASLGAQAIAWSHLQRRALGVAGADGLRLAREIAMLSYRSAESFAERFGRRTGARGGFAVGEWLVAHGERLEQRFDAATYRTLIDAMDTHDLAAGRGGLAERLRRSGTAFTGIAIPGDLFCPAREVASWVTAAGGAYREIVSTHGHDAFLLEHEQVSAILRDVLAPPRAESRLNEEAA